MGAIPYPGGTTFRVWAPHATAVFVTGSFDDWAGDRLGLRLDGDGSSGVWSADVDAVGAGAEYRFTIRTAEGDLSRMDPYARHVTNSVGNSIVYDPAAFDWGDDAFSTPSWDDLVIYEMHVGTFAATDDRRGTFDAAGRRLPYLERLGVSAVQVMPPFEFAGDVSWGYNPAHLFAIESGTAGRTRSSVSSATPTRTGSRSSSTSSTTTSGRRISTSGGSTAGPRTTAAGSTSTTTTVRPRHGATRVRTTAAARCARSCGTAP